MRRAVRGPGFRDAEAPEAGGAAEVVGETADAVEALEVEYHHGVRVQRRAGSITSGITSMAGWLATPSARARRGSPAAS